MENQGDAVGAEGQGRDGGSQKCVGFVNSGNCAILVLLDLRVAFNMVAHYIFLTLKCIPRVFSDPGHHSLPSPSFIFFKLDSNFLSIPQSIHYKQYNKKIRKI